MVGRRRRMSKASAQRSSRSCNTDFLTPGHQGEILGGFASLGGLMIKKAKFIKLGEHGKWEDICLKDGTLRLGYYEVPHDLALSGNETNIRNIYLKKNHATATKHARQVLDFYQADSDVMWITFSKGFLWWCRAHNQVEFIGQDKDVHTEGSRLRRTINGWSNCSLKGKELRMNDLSGRLTRAAGFQGTICNLKPDALEDLNTKISGEEAPLVSEARAARYNLQEKIKKLISKLTWKDFELFVDILFAKSGWTRISMAGRTMKDIDLDMIMPITGERAVVQIKSSTTQAEMDSCIKNMEEHEVDKIFFVYHSPPQLFENNYKHLNVMNLDALADAALRTGLIDWLIEKA
jgi:hypothetical protein